MAPKSPGKSPKAKPSPSNTLRAWKQPAALLGIASLLVVGYLRLETQIARLDDRLHDLTKPEGVIGKLSERVVRLEVEQKYRSAAIALGLENPDIKRVKLAPSASFASSAVAVSNLRIVDVEMQYTIAAVDDKSVTFRLNGRLRGRSTGASINFGDTEIVVPRKAGALSLVNLPMEVDGVKVTIALAVLDTTSSDEVVIAIGATSPNRRPA